MHIRIRFSRQTVKALQRRLQGAYEQDDVRLVRRISALLEHVVDGQPVAQVSARWGAQCRAHCIGISAATMYNWLREYMVKGLDSLVYRHAGGRRSKLTGSQKKRLCVLIDAGPEAAGFESACWNSILLRVLIEREFSVLYSRHYVCELLRNLGFTFQKARFVSDHLDEARRLAWRTEEWPQILKKARRRKALLLFGDEASFPQWGSLGYTWARRGQQPLVKTSGKRKGYKVFGLIDYFSGRFFHQAIAGRFNSENYQAFLREVLRQTRKHLFLIQDGARYHTSKAITMQSARDCTRQFFEAQYKRLTVCQLPSYSPDYNPIEYLWKKIKERATHDKYFAKFENLVSSVDKALAFFAERCQEVLNLFGLYCAEVGLQPQSAQ